MAVPRLERLPIYSPVPDLVHDLADGGLGFGQLSGRELEVARLVAKGFSNKEVAQFLEISHWTVAAHLKATFLKLAVRRRSELAYIMRQIV